MMRRLAFACALLLPCVALAVPFWHHAMHYLVFSAPLNTNGMTAANPSTSWPVPGVAAPDVAWWGDDPTGSGSKTTHAFTQTGTTTSVNTPFCPDGSWSDITSGCMKARRFSATQYYTSDTAAIGNCASADCSACALLRSITDAGEYVVCSKESNCTANGEGWSLYTNAAANGFFARVTNSAASSATVAFDLYNIFSGGWTLVCFSHDYDGNTAPYGNAVADTEGASPGGTITTPSEDMCIGAACDGSAGLHGDVAAVFFWNSLLDATDMAELFEYFAGILDDYSAPVAFTSTGPNCCWVDGAIECFGDDWPMLGCELPPGVTGAGSPADGLLSMPALTNSLPYSLVLSSWSVINTPDPTATSTDLFRDGRSTYKITDNDGAKTEFIYEDVAGHGLSNGQKATLCIYAKSATSSYMDARFYEYQGACAGGATIYEVDPAQLTTAWKQYSWTHTITDATCTTLRVYLAPGESIQATASTGDGEVVAQLYLNQDWCPPTYIETAAAAVGANDDYNLYTISGTSLAAGIPNGTKVAFNVTPRASAATTVQELFEIADSATAVDYYRFYWVNSNSKLYLVGQSAEEGSQKTLMVTNAAWSPTAGTTYAFEVTIHGTAAALSIDGSPVAVTNVTLGTGPNSLDNIAIGGLDDGTSQAVLWVSDFEVQR